ncbi:MAG: hypothetical protein ACRC6O_08645 [Flavobacterium sp.]
MELLITRSARPAFWKYENGSAQEIKLFGFDSHELLHSTWHLQKSLPWEICSMILHHLFEIEIKSFNFDLAGALVAINSSFAREIYRSVFGDRSEILARVAIKRVCNTLNLIERMYDEYLTLSRSSRYTMCQIVKGNSNHFMPWDGILDVAPVASRGIVASPDEKVYQFETGTTNGDTAWLVGEYMKNGMFKCDRFRHPVLCLQVCNYNDYVITKSARIQRCPVTKHFVKLLRRIFGKNLGVFFVYNDVDLENPFDLTRYGFIEF